MKTFDDVLIEKKWIATAVVSAGLKLKSMSSEQSERKKKLNVKVGTGGTFNVAMKEMFSILMKRSEKVESKLKSSKTKKDPVQLTADLKILVEDLKKGFAKSPVAHYVDWQNGVVQGKPFLDVASELMGRMRYNGFGHLLNAINTVLSAIALLSG